jgi:hypothetical protein
MQIPSADSRRHVATLLESRNSHRDRRRTKTRPDLRGTSGFAHEDISCAPGETPVSDRDLLFAMLCAGVFGGIFAVMVFLARQ